MTNKIIYIVTQGSYSDYHIVGVFEDKELAEEYAKQNKADVEEHFVKTDTDLELPRGYLNYQVFMKENGEVKSVSVTSPELKNDWDELDFAYKNENKPYHFKTGNRYFVVSTDMGETGAIKISNERRAQLIAENKWPVKGEKIR